MKLTYQTILFVLLTIAIPYNLYSLKMPKSSFEHAFKRADIIFTGIVVKIELTKCVFDEDTVFYYGSNPIVTLWVQDKYKGKIGNEVVINGEYFNFEFLNKYLVYAWYDSSNTIWFKNNDIIIKEGKFKNNNFKLYNTTDVIRTTHFNDAKSDILKLESM